MPGTRAILPPEVWGDGDPEGVRQRAAERMQDTARAAAAFGVQQVNGFTGSSIWHLIYSFPPVDYAEVDRGYEDFAERWGPIIDVFDREGVRFGLEVHPTEIAYDFVTTRRALEAIGRRDGFGSTSTRATWSTSSSTPPRSSPSSPTGSTTST
jgi:sugar phosphate isomerase/epimerase